ESGVRYQHSSSELHFPPKLFDLQVGSLLKSLNLCRSLLINITLKQAKILKILQATSSEQPVCLFSSVHRRFRFFSGIHAARSSSSGLVGCLSCVWTLVMWAWTVHRHPDSHGSRLCQNYHRAVLPVRRSNSHLCFQHRVFHGEIRTVVNQKAGGDGDKQKQRMIKWVQLSSR
ncbi:hypothetical protein AMECASPLE_036551, partial [Ameca splendens]